MIRSKTALSCALAAAVFTGAISVPSIAGAESAAEEAPSERSARVVADARSRDERAARAFAESPDARLIIGKFRSNATASERASVRSRHRLESVRTLQSTGAEIFRIPNDNAPSDVARQMRENRAVEYAEANAPWTVDGSVVRRTRVAPQSSGSTTLTSPPNDPRYGQLWGLHNTGQTVAGMAGVADVDVNAPEAWASTTGSPSVVVAVTDEGVDVNHPDLAGRIWTNPGEVAGNGVDDDANGYVDDVNGWDFYNDDKTVYDPQDGDAHGTHVAGTIAAAANNSIGVAGVAPSVKIMPLKFLGPEAGSTSDAILAFDYAASFGVRIINASWGGGGSSLALQDAIARSGAALFASAGNDAMDNDTTPHYPDGYNLSNIVSVAAVDSTGQLAGFSNYGAEKVDVGAPGDAILSTYPGGRVSQALQITSTSPAYKAMVWGFGLEDITGSAPRTDAISRAMTHLGATASTPILLVDDDAGGSAQGLYASALASAGFTLVTTRTVTSPSGGPTAAEMAGKVVVWQTGDDFGGSSGFGPLHPNDQGHLSTHLSVGGGLLLAGPDAIYRTEDSDFVVNYLHTRYVSEGDPRTTLSGEAGSAYAGTSYTATGTDSSDGTASIYRDLLVPRDAAARSALALPVDYANAYQYLSGTSMAAPHAAGVAALYASQQPTAGAVNIADTVRVWGSPLASLSGTTTSGKLVRASGVVEPPTPTTSATINLATDALDYDGTRNQLLVVPSGSVPQIGKSLIEIDPDDGSIGRKVALGSGAYDITVAGDGSRAYVALKDSPAVAEVNLTTFTVTRRILLGTSGFLGPHYGEDVEVQPGNPGVIAVSRRNRCCSPRHEGVAIFDSGVQRSATTQGHTGSNRITWSSDPGLLYGFNNETSESGLRKVLVSATGAAQDTVVGINGGDDIAFHNARIHSTNGQVISASTLTADGSYANSGLLAFEGTKTYILNSQGLHRHDGVTYLKESTVAVPALEYKTFVDAGNVFAARSADKLVLIGSGASAGDFVAPTAPASVLDVGEADSLTLRPTGLAAGPNGSTVYATVRSDASQYAGEVVEIDVATRSVTRRVFVGGEPRRVAVSTDGSRLIVGHSAANRITEIDVASFTIARTVALQAGEFADDLAPAPGDADAYAAQLYGQGLNVAYVDGGQIKATRTHANVTSIAFVGDPERLYGYNGGSTGFELYVMGVSPTGVSVLETHPRMIEGFGLELRGGGGLLYATHGSVVDPAARLRVGQLGGAGVPLPLSHMDRVVLASSSELLEYDTAGRWQVAARSLPYSGDVLVDATHVRSDVVLAYEGKLLFVPIIGGTPPPAGPGLYQESSAALTYTGSWSPQAASLDSGGGIRHTSSVNASVALTFTGSAVRWISRRSPGSGIDDVYIDGAKVASVDRYATTTGYQHVVFERTGLSAGAHTLRIVNTGAKNAAATAPVTILDAIEVFTPVGPGLYQETDAGMRFSSGWSTQASSADSGGGVRHTATNGASLTLSFTGTAVRWISRRSQGSGIEDVYLDGVKVAAVDRYATSTTYQAVVFERTGLSAGAHTIRIVNTGTKNAAATAPVTIVDAIEVFEPVGPGTYQDDHAALRYSGTWTPQSTTLDSGGSVRHTATNGASVTLTFTGSAVRWISRRSQGSGIEDVYLDGVKVGSVDRYATSTTYQAVVFERSGLSAGVHTIRIVNTGTKNASATAAVSILDAIEVFEPVGPGLYQDDHAAMRYSGTWTPQSTTLDNGGSVRHTATNGASVTLSFTGTAVRWISRRSQGSGIEDVYLDGVKVAAVDRYATSTTYQAVVFERTGLGAGVHTVRIVNTGTKNPSATAPVSILDAIEVFAVLPAGLGLYQEDHAALTYTGSWSPQATSHDNGGGTRHTATVGGSVSLTFSGSAVRWLSRRSPGSGIDDVYLDGVKVASVDRYAATTGYQHVVFERTDLTAGAHTLRIVNTGSKNASSTAAVTMLDAIEVFAPVGPGYYQETDAAMRFSNGWSSQSTSSDSGGAVRHTATAGAAVTMSFTGTAVRWVSRRTPGSGIEDVYIDGVKVASVDRYSATTGYQQSVFERTGLGAGAHTIRIVSTGTKNPAATAPVSIVDAIEVLA